jgi:hypothetical protein
MNNFKYLSGLSPDEKTKLVVAYRQNPSQCYHALRDILLEQDEEVGVSIFDLYRFYGGEMPLHKFTYDTILWAKLQK